MPIGRPDWSGSGLSQNVGSGLDTNELAVRLGSGVNFDRTGNVIWYNDGSLPLASFITNHSGALNTLNVYNYYRECGNGSLYVNLNAGVANYMDLSHYCRSWPYAKLSFETAVLCDQQPTDFEIRFVINQAPTSYVGLVGLYNNCKDVQYRDSSLVMHTIYSYANNQFNSGFFIPLKLDIDTSTGKYVRFRFGGDVFDLSDYELSSSPITGIPLIRWYLKAHANATLQTKIYMDRYIVTEDTD